MATEGPIVLSRHQLPQYAVAILIPILGAALSFISSDCSASALRWRKSLTKSRLSPPAVVVTLAWFALYICMGHSSYLVFVNTPRLTMMLSPPLIMYFVQTLLNHFYIIVLFGLQRIDLALVMIVLLWIATALTSLLFYDVDVIAGRLMLAVLAWVSINVYLNLFLVLNNDVYTEASIPSPPASSAKSRTDRAKLS